MKATKVNAGLAESNGRLLLGIWLDSLHVTCGLTACTPGSAPGPTLGNEYGKTLPLHYTLVVVHATVGLVMFSVLIKGKDQAVECKCMSALVQLLLDESTAVRASCCGAIMMHVYAHSY